MYRRYRDRMCHELNQTCWDEILLLCKEVSLTTDYTIAVNHKLRVLDVKRGNIEIMFRRIKIGNCHWRAFINIDTGMDVERHERYDTTSKDLVRYLRSLSLQGEILPEHT